MSTLNHSQYQPLRFSPPRQQDMVKQVFNQPESVVINNSKQPSPLHFSYQHATEEKKINTSNKTKQDQFDPLRSRYSDHMNVMSSKSGQRTRSISKDSHSPAARPYEQNNVYQPANSSLSETNPLQNNSVTNPLQISSNGLKMSDSSMQSVY